jgi:hypothetical protein
MMFIKSPLADYVQTKQKLCFRFRPNELVLYENNPQLSMFKFREELDILHTKVRVVSKHRLGYNSAETGDIFDNL